VDYTYPSNNNNSSLTFVPANAVRPAVAAAVVVVRGVGVNHPLLTYPHPTKPNLRLDKIRLGKLG
jgi:hypothetical protein